MKITLELDLVQCIGPMPNTPSHVNDAMSGHLHFWQVDCPVKSDGKEIGQIGADGAMNVLVDVYGTLYHIGGLSIWQGVFEALTKPEAKA